jgi:hypothetical protein
MSGAELDGEPLRAPGRPAVAISTVPRASRPTGLPGASRPHRCQDDADNQNQEGRTGPGKDDPA